MAPKANEWPEKSLVLDPGRACLTANTFSRIFAPEEKASLKFLFSSACPSNEIDEATLCYFAAMLASVSFAGEPTPATKLEIAHLFSYLQASGCQFYRNGTWYGSSEAVSHLNKKYQYLLGKGLVTSSEAFIEKLASESSTSGRAYRVRCGSNPAVNSADWFGAELEKYRKGRH